MEVALMVLAGISFMIIASVGNLALKSWGLIDPKTNLIDSGKLYQKIRKVLKKG